MFRLTWLIAVALLAPSCQFSEDRELSREVQPADFFGRWVLTAQSKDDMAAMEISLTHPVRDYSFELRSGGDCVFSSFVAVSLSGGPVSPMPAVPCRWTLSPYKDRSQRVVINLEPTTYRSASYQVDEAKVSDRLVLWQLAGDPDAWKYVEYERLE